MAYVFPSPGCTPASGSWPHGGGVAARGRLRGAPARQTTPTVTTSASAGCPPGAGWSLQEGSGAARGPGRGSRTARASGHRRRVAACGLGCRGGCGGRTRSPHPGQGRTGLAEPRGPVHPAAPLGRRLGPPAPGTGSEAPGAAGTWRFPLMWLPACARLLPAPAPCAPESGAPRAVGPTRRSRSVRGRATRVGAPRGDLSKGRPSAGCPGSPLLPSLSPGEV